MNANIITTEKDFYRLEGRFNEIQVIKSDLQILDEKKLINSILKKNEFIILNDVNGEQKVSVGFSKFIQKKLNSGMNTLTFVIGGPYGVSEEIISMSNYQLSLSKMTFSHEMIRLFFTEQLYREISILKNEPYTHK